MLTLLSYGLDKYVLLRVGPFPDLYATMALNHKERGDDSSSLIAAEAANNKFVGFASTFRAYSALLNSFPKRDEEARDAAQMCLRLPLPSIGMMKGDFQQVATLGQIAEPDDTPEEAIAKLQIFFEKIRQSEAEEDKTGAQQKTPEQTAIDEANYLLDTISLTSGDWDSIRSQLGEIYGSVGRDDMASFVDPARG